MINSRTLIALSSTIFLILVISASSIQGATLEEEAESVVRSGYALWNEGNQAAILEAGDSFTIGFGLRTRAPRGAEPVPPAIVAQIVKAFFESMEYYRIKIEELHTKAFGDVVVVWGFHTEDFKLRERSPEFLRVRFSSTLKKTPGGWRTLISHRDIQPFDDQGQYIPIAMDR